MLRSAGIGVLLLVLVMGGVGLRLGNIALGWTTGLSPTAEDTPAGSYGIAGPHAVGLRTLSDGSAAVRGAIWYPAGAGGSGSVRHTYGLKAFGDAPFALATYAGVALRDAEPDPAGGPHPLVIVSPGFAFGAATYAWLAEHLASHGFVVLAIEHAESLDPSALWRATVDRPRDTVAALELVDAELQQGAWDGLVDLGHVAIVGHSYGGYTALAAAGARLDSDRLSEICANAAPDDPITFQCDALVPHIDEMADAAGMRGTPTDLWPNWGDARVDAAIALAGDAVMFGERGVAEIEIPIMGIGGTADVDAPYTWGTRLAYEAASSERRVEIGLEGAEHMVFTGPCETRRRVLAVFAEPFCMDPAWDRASAHDLVRHYATAFLLAELKGDAAAAGALAPDLAPDAGVLYRAEGY